MSDRLLVLVRHGQSEWNLKNLFTGWKDPDLTEKGVAEASVPAGSWEVDVRLDGFRPAHYVLELPPGQACTLKFRLSIDNSAGFFL